VTGLILLVEDEVDLADVVEFQLVRAGFAVRRAATGPDALVQAVREPRPDAVVLDVMLPGLSGHEVCRRLRVDPATAHLPILMASARATRADVDAGLAAGADDYLAKPYSVLELVRRVEALLAPDSLAG